MNETGVVLAKFTSGFWNDICLTDIAGICVFCFGNVLFTSKKHGGFAKIVASFRCLLNSSG